MADYLETMLDKFTFRVATDRLYSSEGLWVLRVEPREGRRVRIGVTDYLQQHSGDCAFATVKPVGTVLRLGDELAALETIKVNLALSSPVSGTVVAVNGDLDPSPEKVNQSPYEEGWLAEVQTSSWDTERAALLEPTAYSEVMQNLARQELDTP